MLGESFEVERNRLPKNYVKFNRRTAWVRIKLCTGARYLNSSSYQNRSCLISYIIKLRWRCIQHRYMIYYDSILIWFMIYVECSCMGLDPWASNACPIVKSVFEKYACCILPNTLQPPNCSTGRHVWMEIVQKLVAVALVSVVSSANGLQLSVALSLGMAATSALVQPYAQPQALMDSQFLFKTWNVWVHFDCHETEFWGFLLSPKLWCIP